MIDQTLLTEEKIEPKIKEFNKLKFDISERERNLFSNGFNP